MKRGRGWNRQSSRNDLVYGMRTLFGATYKCIGEALSDRGFGAVSLRRLEQIFVAERERRAA